MWPQIKQIFISGYYHIWQNSIIILDKTDSHALPAMTKRGNGLPRSKELAKTDPRNDIIMIFQITLEKTCK